MARGAIDPQLVIGLATNPATEEPGRRDSHEADHHHHDHDHDHDHHDHTHVEMESVVLRVPGVFARQQLEQALPDLVRRHGLIRVKGRLWLPGKARPLEIQAVGPRLDSWFADQGAERVAAPGLELVLLGFSLDAEALRTAFTALLLDPASP
jgi:cobalamin biosynthesis protein CobW